MPEPDLFRLIRTLHADVSAYVLKTFALAAWFVLNIEAYLHLPTWAWVSLFVGQAVLFLRWLWWATGPNAIGKPLHEELAEIYQRNARMPDYGPDIEEDTLFDEFNAPSDSDDLDRCRRIDRLISRIEELADASEASTKKPEQPVHAAPPSSSRRKTSVIKARKKNV